MTNQKSSATRKSTRAFLVSLVLLILISVVNWGVITGWGNVKITRINLVGNDGLRYSALLYVPANATDETPAPAIMMYHGLSGSARNHESWAVEFARRGFVCLAPDNMGAGDSEFSMEGGEFDPSIPDAFTQYLLSLPFVDDTRWAMGGHSLGSDTCLAMALKYQPNVAMFSDGGGMTFQTAVTEENYYHGNPLFLLGTADKSGQPADFINMTQTMLEYNGVSVDGELVPGQLYGSFEESNAGKLALIPDQVHEAAFTTPAHIEEILNFTQAAFEVPNPIDGSEQIWMWKDITGMVGMVCFVCCLICLALMLIDKIPTLAIIKQPLPRNIGMRGVPLAISVVLALVFPVLALYTGSFGLMSLLASSSGKEALIPLFSVRFTNIAFSLIIVLNIFGALMFVLYHKTWGKKNFGATFQDYGVTIEGGAKRTLELIGKALLLAGIVVAVGWTYLLIQKGIFGTDFYCLFWGYKPIAGYKFVYYIPYMIVWALCFAVAAVGMCVERRLPSTGNESKDTAIAVAVNILLAAGAISVVNILETVFQIQVGHGSSFFASWGIPITRIWGMPIGMILGAGGNTYLYRKTGNIWLGAILMGFIAALGACLYGQIRFA